MDRISQLPDCLLHHILSFLNIQLAVRTCVLSKRWRNVWTYMPTLHFDYVSYELLNLPSNDRYVYGDKEDDEEAKDVCFKQFVLGILRARRPAGWNIKRMTVHYDFPDIDEILFNLLYYFARLYNVEELSINARHLCFINWSCCLSTCQLLRLTGDYGGLWIPLRIDFLKSLEIVTDEPTHLSFKGDMFESCPNLESLVLRGHVYKRIRITAPRLEYLEIGYSFINNQYLPETRLLTPKLAHVKFENFLPDLRSVENLPCLCKVELDLNKLFLRSIHCDPVIKQIIVEKLTGLFEVLQNVESLTSSPIAAEVISFFQSSSHDVKGYSSRKFADTDTEEDEGIDEDEGEDEDEDEYEDEDEDEDEER